MTAGAPLRVLEADCSACVGLCCVAPAFAASADFAFDKPAGDPCPNLEDDDRCRIHDRLRPSGFAGCVVFDCFGAGQRVTGELLPGTSWRAGEAEAAALFGAFAAALPLHELLYYLRAALALPAATPIAGELTAAYLRTDTLTARAATLTRADVQVHREGVNELLRAASGLARAPYAATAVSFRGRDLAGADLRGADLRGAELRGAELIGADLRGTDLDLTDVTGADLRAADVRGADLRGTLFLTASQLRGATGDSRTRIPAGFERPAHWT
ncbi:MAG TPA: pentapeptide repeat-containing protein [Candidatus Limnocylindrales bacterium]|nr:pentapeptide repeat-containing protein [Candidatus Limnocylindrales bacterium]